MICLGGGFDTIPDMFLRMAEEWSEERKLYLYHVRPLRALHLKPAVPHTLPAENNLPQSPSAGIECCVVISTVY